MAVEITHEPDAQRYTLRIDGSLVSALQYRDQGPSVVMHHTITVPQYRGQGHAAQLVEFAVKEVAASGRKITPTCWYVADWFDAHPEYAEVRAGF